MKVTQEQKRQYTVLWETIDWPAAHLTQQVIQERIVMAYRKQDTGEVYRLQREMLQNRNLRLCAVKRVTSNKGGNTPGIDNQVLAKPWEKWQASILLLQWAHSLKTYEAKPVKRVWIPKEDGSKRPLGIPTIFDRLTQCIFYYIMDPIVEENSDRHSYGFRARRDVGDLIQQLHLWLSTPTSASWVLDADIKACFDEIEHSAVLENCIVFEKGPIQQWLRAPILHNDGKKIKRPKSGLGYFLEESIMGTPQGGVISPILSNIVLNGLEKAILEPTHLTDVTYPKNPNYKVNIARFADDFSIFAPTKDRLLQARKRAETYLKTRGLRLNKLKTRVCHITDGFQIVGFWIQKRRYDYRKQSKPINPHYGNFEGADIKTHLVITIPPKKVASHKDKIRDLFQHRKKTPKGKVKRAKTDKNRLVVDTIKSINRRVIGWRRNYAMSYSSVWQFIELDYWLTMETIIPYFRKVYRTKTGLLPKKEAVARFKHPRKNWEWRIGTKDENGRLVHFARYYETEQHTDLSVLKRQKIPSILKKKGQTAPDINPYTQEGREWWNRRKRSVPNNANLYSRAVKKHGNKCGLCGIDLGHDGQVTELHRIIPGSEGGKYTLKNVIPVHLFCHKRHHALKKKGESKTNPKE
jgi:group II intron reverse transcriptase/maturase